MAILNQDREVSDPAVINTFSLQFDSITSPGIPALHLRCLSINLSPNLTWESMNVSSLAPGILSRDNSLSIPFVNISYLEGVAVNDRDVILSVIPINNITTGFYSCQSTISSYTTTVFTTLEQPFWRVTSCPIIELPVGGTVRMAALYADHSDGIVNMGNGFAIEVIFTPIGDAESVSLMNTMTETGANEFVYSFIAGGAINNGQYTLLGEHACIQLF